MLGAGTPGGAGGRSGVGAAIALRLATDGASVLAVDPEPGTADATARRADGRGGGALQALAAGSATQADAEEIVAECRRRFGRVDVLCTDVHRGLVGGSLDTPLERWTEVLDAKATSGTRRAFESALILVLMTETESLIAEVRQLRADVARLHAAVPVRHSWMKMLFKDLSTNPRTQYKVHKWGAIYWLINFPLVCCLFFFDAHAVAQAWHLHHADLLDLRQPCDRLRRHVSRRGSVRAAAAAADPT